MTIREPQPVSQPYEQYAAVYDRTGQIRFSILMAMYLGEVLQRHPCPGKTMLDLACGTGTLALLQAEAGWEVTGLDLSAAMLREARRKQRAADVQATFVEDDMRGFELARPVDLVTCCYDSLNYLLDEDELRACFGSVRRALVPDGLFCFDLATDYFLRHYWQGIDRFEADDYKQVMASSYDEASGRSTLVLSGTLLNGADAPRRFEEIHVERSYAPEAVERLLRGAGLLSEGFYDCFTHQPPNDASLRHFWVARRPS